MSNSKLIEQAFMYAPHDPRIAPPKPHALLLKLANALQSCEWNTDMEAAPKKARTIELLPEVGEVILVSGSAWMRVSTPEET